MKFFFFLTIAVLFTLIDLSSETTLADLFSISNGVVVLPSLKYPHIREYLVHEIHLGKFDACDRVTPLPPGTRLVVRGPVIIGVLEGDYIKELTDEHGIKEHVYDTRNGGSWKKLTYPELKKLGVGQRLLYVQTVNEIESEHVLPQFSPSGRTPAQIAQLAAMEKAHSLSISLLVFLEEGVGGVINHLDPVKMRQVYHREYDRQYSLALQNEYQKALQACSSGDQM